MSKHTPPPPGASLPSTGPTGEGSAEVRRFVSRAIPFVLLGLVLYLGVYAAAEWLVYRTAERNRFYTVKTAPPIDYDDVILGASHAAVFDYRNMNSRLEEMTGAEILNLATVGSGIAPNRLILEYFYESGHETDAVVYILDSFAFYSREWNEARLQDTELFARAPFDPTLARLLLEDPAGRSVFLDYVTGFSKINNSDRFEPDLFEAEGSRFERTYRPIAQIDRERIGYLYPDSIGPSTLEESPYLAEFEDLVRYVQSHGDRFIVIRPPIPERIYAMLPEEEVFDRTMERVTDRLGAEMYDFTGVNNDPDYFYDSDHLNQEGAIRFARRYLSRVLRPGG